MGDSLEELELIHQKMQQYGTENLSAYLRKMALDGFIDLVREEQQRSRTQREKLEPSRPSVRDKLKQELPAHKSAAPKKREPERYLLALRRFLRIVMFCCKA